jgi:glyoxylase-like metal-dependent hydrolase (beta-lactamase superfamily II)
MAAFRFPPQMHVFVRDWLSANHVVIRGTDGAVVVDTGYGRHAPLTLALVASRMGLDGAPLVRIVNTHCHSDHMGGNAALKRAYGCTIAIPRGEARAVAAWDERALLLSYAGQHAERFEADESIEPGSTHVFGDLEWQALAAPGHDMGALVFYNPEHRLLISGDALWENGYGFVMPPAVDPDALPGARATLDTIARLDVACVIPGHGEPFRDVNAALERAYRRTASWEADPLRMAWHAMKVVLAFDLLVRERMPLASLPAFVDETPLFPDFNARFFARTGAELAEGLVADLERAGAVRREHGELLPA